MKFYLKINKDTNIITDAITYSYGDYVEYDADSLPVGVNGGWFKLENGAIVEHPELKPVAPEDEITTLKTQVNSLQSQLLEAQSAINTLLGV